MGIPRKAETEMGELSQIGTHTDGPKLNMHTTQAHMQISTLHLQSILQRYTQSTETEILRCTPKETHHIHMHTHVRPAEVHPLGDANPHPHPKPRLCTPHGHVPSVELGMKPQNALLQKSPSPVQKQNQVRGRHTRLHLSPPISQWWR